MFEKWFFNIAGIFSLAIMVGLLAFCIFTIHRRRFGALSRDLSKRAPDMLDVYKIVAGALKTRYTLRPDIVDMLAYIEGVFDNNLYGENRRLVFLKYYRAYMDYIDFVNAHPPMDPELALKFIERAERNVMVLDRFARDIEISLDLVYLLEFVNEVDMITVEFNQSRYLVDVVTEFIQDRDKKLAKLDNRPKWTH